MWTRFVAAVQGEDVDVEIRVHTIMFTVEGVIIHQTNAETSLVNLSGLRLLIVYLVNCYLPYCCSYFYYTNLPVRH